jgi:hypothetical protein
MGKNNKLSITFLIAGIITAALLHFFIIKGLLNGQHISFNWKNFIDLHNNIALYLIDSLWLILPLFGWLTGRVL